MRLLLLLLAVCLAPYVRAQKNTTISSESTTEDHYVFKTRVDKKQSKQLIAAFTDVTVVNLNDRFRGKITNVSDEGIRVTLNTPKRQLKIKYEGTDETVLAVAKQKAKRVKTFFSQQDAPADPKK